MSCHMSTHTAHSRLECVSPRLHKHTAHTTHTHGIECDAENITWNALAYISLQFGGFIVL